MYELVRITEKSCYIRCPAKIGLVRLEGDDVCLIDSGSDKEAGRKVRQILDANGWHLTAIYNTHSNADHIGGNAYLQKQTGCQAYAPGIECDFTRHPILEPSFLYGGYPFRELRHKFLLAQPSGAHDAYNVGDVVNYNGTLYQSVIDGNVWSPDVYPAGWTVYEGGTVEPEPEPTYPEWAQPSGAHDAYNTGDRVTYNGKVYESTIDGNVWAPDAYPQGWTELGEVEA